MMTTPAEARARPKAAHADRATAESALDKAAEATISARVLVAEG